MRYLDPKNDLTFKRVFAEHPHLLISFLNNILPLEEGRKIEHIEYLPAELIPEIPLFKYTIVDVRCLDNFGRQFIVEMQMLWTDSFKNRVLFNTSKAYIKQLEKGEHFESLQPVYALSLVNHNFENEMDAYFHHYKIVTVDEPKRHLPGLEFVFIELKKVKAKNLKEKALGVLWLRFLTEIENRTENLSPDFMEHPDLKEATDILKESAFNKAELETYDKYWDSVMVEQALLDGAIAKGYKQGINEEKENIIIIGHKEGISIESLARITRLSVPEVEVILKKAT
jgi:predicted transposase/invertase (TIGR01784 family)